MIPQLAPFRQRSLDDSVKLLHLYAESQRNPVELHNVEDYPPSTSKNASSRAASASATLHPDSSRRRVSISSGSRAMMHADRAESMEENMSLFSFVEVPPGSDDGGVNTAHASLHSGTFESVKMGSGTSGPEPKSDKFGPLTMHWGPFEGRIAVLERAPEKVGQGATGFVCHGRMRVFREASPESSYRREPVGDAPCEFSMDVAVKVIHMRDGVECMMEMARILATRFRVDHPGICHAFACGVFPTGPSRDSWLADTAAAQSLNVVVAMEYAEGGSLGAALLNQEALSEDDTRDVLWDIVPAVVYLHDEVGIVHNDIKPNNILVFPNAKGERRWENGHRPARAHRSGAYHKPQRYRLCDFGVAQPISQQGDVLTRMTTSRRDVLKSSADRSVFRGTATFMSPESCLGVGDTPTNDVWSIGITTYFLLTGRLPWREMESAYPEMILYGYRDKFSSGRLFSTTSNVEAGSQMPSQLLPQTTGEAERAQNTRTPSFSPILDELENSKYSDEAKDFIRRCLVENPLERWASSELLDHPFMKGTKLQ